MTGQDSSDASSLHRNHPRMKHKPLWFQTYHCGLGERSMLSVQSSLLAAFFFSLFFVHEVWKAPITAKTDISQGQTTANDSLESNKKGVKWLKAFFLLTPDFSFFRRHDRLLSCLAILNRNQHFLSSVLHIGFLNWSTHENHINFTRARRTPMIQPLIMRTHALPATNYQQCKLTSSVSLFCCYSNHPVQTTESLLSVRCFYRTTIKSDYVLMTHSPSVHRKPNQLRRLGVLDQLDVDLWLSRMEPAVFVQRCSTSLTIWLWGCIASVSPRMLDKPSQTRDTDGVLVRTYVLSICSDCCPKDHQAPETLTQPMELPQSWPVLVFHVLSLCSHLLIYFFSDSFSLWELLKFHFIICAKPYGAAFLFSLTPPRKKGCNGNLKASEVNVSCLKSFLCNKERALYHDLTRELLFNS